MEVLQYILAAPAGRNFFKDELDIAITSIVDGIFTAGISIKRSIFTNEAGCRSMFVKLVDFRDQEPWGAYASSLAPITPQSF